MEGAIGYDCRRLEDGRRAVFRHTHLHRRIRRDLFERRDAIMLIQSSLIATASLGSHPRADRKVSIETTLEKRGRLLKAAFPYLEINESEPKEEDYSAYFDELDAYIEENKAKTKGNEVGGQSEK